MRRQAMDQEKIFADNISDKEQLLEYTKSSPKSIEKKKTPKQTSNPIKKWTKKRSIHLAEEYTDGKYAHKNMFNKISHQRNAN